MDWLRENNVEYNTLVMYPNKIKKNNRSLAEYKASVINDLGITLYYEDDIRIADYLIENCPNTNVVLVRYNKR